MSVFRDDLLAGKVAFVTGGAAGICRAIAEAYLRHGAKVVIVSRKAERIEAAARELGESTGSAALGVAADVRDGAAVEAAFDRAIDRFGRIDIVVNGAAGNFLAPAAALSYNAFKTVIEIDTIGTFNVSKAAFSKWLGAHGGVILNVSATLHYTAVPLQTHPGAAKAAVDAMTRHLAVEWGPMGIRVNAIAPGPIEDTEGMRRLLMPELRDKLLSTIPLKRFGRCADVADAALFLASDAASFINGALLVVDGGSWMTAAGFHLLG
jgi:peroxisomal 2,4-dienoyl-CoA reductase